MVVLAHSSNYQNCIKKTNKIPEYARDFKNEYLFVRGINKSLDSLVNKIKNKYYDLDQIVYCSNIFLSNKFDRSLYMIRKFLKAQELNYLYDISSFEFKEHDVININIIFNLMETYLESDDYYGDFLEEYEIFREFYEQINYKFDDIIYNSDSD